MTDTTHKVLVKFEADTKGVEAGTRRIAKEASKLSKDQKKATGDTISQTKKLHQASGGNPQQQQRMARQELRDMRERIKLIERENRLLSERSRTMRSSVADQRRQAREQQRTTFGGGFRKAMGFTEANDPNRPNLRSRLGSGAGSAVRAGIGLGGMGLAALLSIPIQAISSDYQAYFTYARQRGGLAGMAKGASFGAGLTTGSVDSLKDRMAGIGYAPNESISALRSFTRASGASSAEGGMRAAKALGLEAEEVSGLFGELRRGGGSFGEKGFRDFQRILAAGVKSGVDASTLPEYLEGIKTLTTGAASGAGGAVSALPYAQLLSIFEKSGAAGLKGARGASVLGALEEGFKAPGGGDEGLAVIMGSLGFGRAGGNTSYYSAKKMMEQGFKDDPGRLKDLFQYVDRITGGGEEANLYMEGLMGGRLTLDQIETVRGALEGGASTDEVSKMLEEMTATELDHLTSIDSNIAEFLEATIRSSKIEVDDINRGEKNHESIEKMQDAVHKLLEDTLPIVQATLPVIAEGVTFIGGGITKMVEVMTNLHDYFNPPNAVGATGEMTTSARGFDSSTGISAEEDALRDIVRDDRISSTAEILEVVRANRAAIARAAGADPAAAEEAFSAIASNAASIYGTTSSAEPTEAIARIVTALDRLSESVGIANPPTEVDTRAELSAYIGMLTAFGLSLPPSVRAAIDTTGGSP